MMDQMRRNMPLILWILVIAFVLTIVFSWGMGGFKEKQKPGIVGIIADQEITYDFFQDIVSRQISSYTERTGVEPQDQTIRDLRNQAWDGLVREILMNKEAERLGIRVSDAEVVDQVKNNPPEFIQKSEYFMTDGNFDISKYQSFLMNPQNRNQVIYLEETYRRTLLERKLLQLITSTVYVPTTELFRRFEEKNVSGIARYVNFAADSMQVDSSQITQDKIEEYYFAHRQDFFVPEKRRIIFVKFKNETSSEDSANVYDLADEIKRKLDQGQDFGYLALIYSDHHTASDSGRLGWIPKKQIELAADSIIWKTPVGKYFGPLTTRYGVHFYKVLDRRIKDGELKSELQIIQLKFLPSADTKDAVANKALSFAEEAKEGDFVTIAKAYGVEVDTSGYFPRQGSFVPGLGKVVSEVEWAFENPVGITSEVYPLRNGWLVFKIIDRIPEHYASIDESRERIFKVLYKEARVEAAFEECSKFYNSLSEKENWAEKAKELGLQVEETDREFRFGDFIKNIGRDAAFTAVLFRAQPGELYGPVKGIKGSFLIELLSRTPVDSNAFEKDKYEYLPTLLQKKQELVFSRWYESLKEKYKIEDYRYMYYKKM